MILKRKTIKKKLPGTKVKIPVAGFKSTFGFKLKEMEILRESKNMPCYEINIIHKVNGKLCDQIKLKYNPVFLFMKGHDLAQVFNEKILFAQRDKEQDQIKLALILKKENGFVFTKYLKGIIDVLSKK